MTWYQWIFSTTYYVTLDVEHATTEMLILSDKRRISKKGKFHICAPTLEDLHRARLAKYGAELQKLHTELARVQALYTEVERTPLIGWETFKAQNGEV